jgi:hypothetical protein
MTLRAATCSMLFGLTALLPAATGCGARSDLAPEGSEASFRCADGSRAGAVGCRSVAFADAVDYPVAKGLNKVALADLNGDGALDLVLVGLLDEVTVLLNQGDGVFSDGVPYATSLAGASGLVGVSDVSAGDLNQDGAVDLVVSPIRDDGTSVSVLLNDGHGAFASGVLYAAGLGPHGVALGDLDGDGLLDIATANTVGDDVSVLSNLGDGTFGPPVHHGSLDNPLSITVADLDRDGRLDLVAKLSPVGTTTAFWTGLFLNAGGGIFVGPTLHSGFGGSAVEVGDVDGDGWPDLASNHLDFVEVRLNAGDGTFGEKVRYPLATYTSSLAMADLNGDCRPDIAAVGGDDAIVGVLPNLGDGTFGPADAHVVEEHAYWIAAGDLNGDGRVDLAITYGYSGFGLVSVLLNRGCGP